MSNLTRRKIIAGAAASTAAAAIGHVTNVPRVFAASPRADPAPDPMESFILISSALTGIQPGLLAPPVDTTGLKFVYFEQASQVRPTFAELLSFYNAHRNPDPNDLAQKAVINTIFQRADFRALCQSIILAWYMGVWTDPQSLQTKTPSARVVSASAYTQGWIWRIAQSHPMGYSNLAFGYWNDDPKPFFDPKQFMIEEQ